MSAMPAKNAANPTPAPRSASNSFLFDMVDHATGRDGAGKGGDSISLHTGDPGTAGASEVTGGGYGRITTVWGAPAMNGADAQSIGSDCTFNLPASTTANFYGVWGPSGFRYGAALVPPVVIDASGPGQALITPVYVERAG